MTVTADNVRETMQIEGATSISNDSINAAITQATQILINKTDDDLCIRYYASFILAKTLDWKTVQKTGDVSFHKQNPSVYKFLFQECYDAIVEGEIDTIPGSMILSDPNFDGVTRSNRY